MLCCCPLFQMKNTFSISFFFSLFFLISIDTKSQDGNKIVFKDGKYGMTTTANKITKEIIKPKLDDIKHLYKERIYMAKQNGKWGFFIVYTFKHEVYQIGTPEFDEITFLKDLQHNEKGDYMGSTAYFLVKKGGKFALLNFQIDEAPKKFNISPYFDEIGTTAEEIKSSFKKMFYVKKDSLYGIYNARGVQRHPIIYSAHEQYYDSIKKITYHALTKNNESYLLVDNQTLNYPLMSAEKIWYDERIFVKNNNDTLTFEGGGLKSIKK